MLKVLLLVFLLAANSAFSLTPEFPTAIFAPAITFSKGDSGLKLMWNSDEKGMILQGPFQGPMAIVCDSSGNLLISDTLNARVIKVDSSGKLIAEYDLAALASQAGLIELPAQVDLAVPAADRFLVADASNNAIIEIDTASGKARAFKSPPAGNSGHWTQINHIHTDKAGNIYIEDVARQLTQVIDKDGRALQSLPGQIGIAVSGDSRVAMVISDDKYPKRRAVYVSEKPGADLRLLATPEVDNPILSSSIIGFDAENNLHIALDTESVRHYLAFKRDGEQVRKRTALRLATGYDANRGCWIDEKGEIYSLRVKHPVFEIVKLR